jgi:hypothetical protein
MNWIGIDTTRYSKVVRAFLNRYPHAVVRLDNLETSTSPDEWCTNRKLKSLRDFSLAIGDQVILSFHDHPDELMAAEEQLEFVQELRSQKLIRFSILREGKSLLQRLMDKLWVKG